MVKVVFHTIRNCSKRKEFAPFGSLCFPFREVPILKNDAIEEEHCLIWYSPFGVRYFFSVQATTPLVSDPSDLAFVLGAQKNWLTDTVLFGCTQNIFWLSYKSIIF